MPYQCRNKESEFFTFVKFYRALSGTLVAEFVVNANVRDTDEFRDLFLNPDAPMSLENGVSVSHADLDLRRYILRNSMSVEPDETMRALAAADGQDGLVRRWF